MTVMTAQAAPAVDLFGETPDGRPVRRARIAGGGLSVSLIAFGATVQDLRLDGVAHPLVLGSDRLKPYLAPMRHFGALVGRYANRIGGARFELDGRERLLDANWRGHCLHGGGDGISRQIWRIEELCANAAVMAIDLPHGHMGFPGAMSIRATFSLPGEGRLRIEIEATADQATPCSIAHHGYFNLDGSADAGDHLLEVAAEGVLAVDGDLIPTGEIAPVAGTPLDFRAAKPVREAALDHCFAPAGAGALRHVATLTGASGVAMKVATDAPGVQVYDGAGLNCAEGSGHDGRGYGPRAGVAIETQEFPDAPNRPEFPDAILRPGETYRHVVEYSFSTAG